MTTAFDLKRNSGMPSLGTHTFMVVRGMERDGPKYPYALLFCKVIDEDEDREKQASLLLSHSPDARFRVDAFLDAIQASEQGQATLEDFVGKTFRGVVEHDTFEGTLRAKIAQTMPLASAEQMTLATDDVQGIPADIIVDDDIPF